MVVMFGGKGIVHILALQILNIFKLMPEVCHTHVSLGIAASFLSTACPNDYYMRLQLEACKISCT